MKYRKGEAMLASQDKLIDQDLSWKEAETHEEYTQRLIKNLPKSEQVWDIPGWMAKEIVSTHQFDFYWNNEWRDWDHYESSVFRTMPRCDSVLIRSKSNHEEM